MKNYRLLPVAMVALCFVMLARAFAGDQSVIVKRSLTSMSLAFTGNQGQGGERVFYQAIAGGAYVTSRYNSVPVVVAVSPEPNATAVDTSATLSVVFDIEMDASTINESTFIVHGAHTGSSPGIITYDGPSKTATFDPVDGFNVGEVVTAILTTGLKSSAGVPMDTGYAWSFTADVSAGDGLFVEDSAYAVGFFPRIVIAADLDNDGDVDLATANEYSNDVSVLLNTGDGTFASHSEFPVGDRPYSVYAADLDNDGDVDLVTANWGSADVSVLLNNGNATFATHVDFAADSCLHSVCAVDLNNDGHIDLATVSHTHHVLVVLINQGDGSFALQTTYPVDDGPVSVHAGDFNGDGHIDLVTANSRAEETSSVSVLMNYGDGTFAPQSIYNVGDFPRLVLVADLDGDGDLDITTPNQNSDDVSVLFNDGDGVFSSHITFPVGAEPYSLCAADYDNDGDIDLATANAGSGDISIILNDGSGTFTPSGDVSADSIPWSLCGADFDGDGDVDLAAANRGPGSGESSVTVFSALKCEDSDGDGYGDPWVPENDCPSDNCPVVYNPMQEDYDLDGIGDSCDQCNNFMLSIVEVIDTVLVKFLSEFRYSPEIIDPDDTSHTITFAEYPHWCTAFYDSVVGMAPDTVFIEPVTVIAEDACNVDTMSFTVQIYLCGDIDNDNIGPNIADLTYLVAYLFTGGPPPVVAATGNTDGIVGPGGPIDISDLTYLVAYLFTGGPPPLCE